MNNSNNEQYKQTAIKRNIVLIGRHSFNLSIAFVIPLFYNPPSLFCIGTLLYLNNILLVKERCPVSNETNTMNLSKQ